MSDREQEEKELQSQIQDQLKERSGRKTQDQPGNLALLAEEIFRLLKRDLEIEANRLGRSI
ncbi:MAG TPA: hypothetical protein PKW33_12380 [Anaerolineaceae bacterium]|nr:hypothetical protein [Anaerolineaceae bacterium]HPN52379.1 hypothetical protein [Anaerolineaceae bacterium]